MKIKYKLFIYNSSIHLPRVTAHDVSIMLHPFFSFKYLRNTYIFVLPSSSNLKYTPNLSPCHHSLNNLSLHNFS